MRAADEVSFEARALMIERVARAKRLRPVL